MSMNGVKLKNQSVKKQNKKNNQGAVEIQNDNTERECKKKKKKWKGNWNKNQYILVEKKREKVENKREIQKNYWAI